MIEVNPRGPPNLGRSEIPQTGVTKMKTYWTILLALTMFLLPLYAQKAAPADGGPDLGDAPDSHNHYGAVMSAYPSIPAEFPTVFDRGGMPPGPIHYNPRYLFFLGKAITIEEEADIGYDADGVNNLEPPSDVADLDLADDGLALNGNFLPNCQPHKVQFTVTATQPLAGMKIYVNIWMDFNRNGRWSDQNQCPTGAADEWVVQNQVISLPSAGTFTFTSNSFLSYLGTDEDFWVRITVAESPAGASSYDGSGPTHGYEYGETEDYLYRPCTDWGTAYPAGVNDGFSTANTENTAPSAGLLAAYPGVLQAPFDGTLINRNFLHSFQGLNQPGYVICGARLEIRLKPLTSNLSDNDSIQLNIFDSMGNPRTTTWSRRIGTLGGVPGLLPGSWDTATYGAVTLWLDLGALPLNPSGTTSMLSALNAFGYLDFRMQDDSSIDYMILHVDYCCP
jgi:hypothetical protein